MGCSNLRVISALLILFASTGAMAQVVNPDFDVGREGWSFYLHPGGGGVIDWVDSDGFPAAGAALIRNNFPADRRDGLRQCLPAQSGQAVVLQAYTFADVPDGNRCSARLIFVDAEQCTAGAAIISELHQWAGPGAGWTLLTEASTAPFGTLAMVVDISHERIAAAGAVPSTCLFDHVRVMPEIVFSEGFE